MSGGSIKRRAQSNTDPLQALRAAALRYPGAEEGVACAGTSLEKRTIKAGKKAFLFLGVADALLKLGESLNQAKSLAAEQPECYKVGANGWVTIRLEGAASPSLELLLRWLDESYRLLAPKKLLAQLSAGGVSTRQAPRD